MTLRELINQVTDNDQLCPIMLLKKDKIAYLDYELIPGIRDDDGTQPIITGFDINEEEREIHLEIN